jgi:hypothetical protein
LGKKCVENNLLNHFIHFQLQNNSLICLQILSKVKLTLGKSFLLLGNTSFSPCKIVPVGHPTGVIFYSSCEVPHGVIDGSRKYFSWPSLVSCQRFYIYLEPFCSECVITWHAVHALGCFNLVDDQYHLKDYQYHLNNYQYHLKDY